MPLRLAKSAGWRGRLHVVPADESHRVRHASPSLGALLLDLVRRGVALGGAWRRLLVLSASHHPVRPVEQLERHLWLRGFDFAHLGGGGEKGALHRAAGIYQLAVVECEGRTYALLGIHYYSIIIIIIIIVIIFRYVIAIDNIMIG